jgi:hypothetical protein
MAFGERRVGTFSRLGNRVRQLLMTQTGQPQPHEQRKIERLLLKLSKMNLALAKPTPILIRESPARAS